MTRKNWSWTAIILLAMGLLLAGCASEVAFREGIPPEEQCTLIVPNSYIVESFSGTSVYWSRTQGNIVTIPSGRHSIQAKYLPNLLRSPGAEPVLMPEIEFDFEAGKTYTINEDSGYLSSKLQIEEVKE